jgi:hypothetical protein
MDLNRNFPRSLAKVSHADLEGSHRSDLISPPATAPVSPKQDSTDADLPANFLPEDSLLEGFLPEDAVIEAVQAELYPEILPPVKKHSSDYLHSRQKQRQKVRQIAEARLTQLSDELLKLADEVRYYHPLMAEAIDDAWDATEEAISFMTSET